MKVLNRYNLTTTVALLAVAVVVLSSCRKDPLSPGLEYMPDMYRSPSYETYSVNPLFEDGLTARKPVEGTMTQGEWPHEGSLVNALPYHRQNTPEEYQLAAADLNPFEATPDVIAKGKDIYEKMCMHCHGKNGGGDGQIVQIEKYPPPPAYNGPLKNLEEGKMFFTITYGKGLMGPHASLLTKEERWKVIRYVQELQKI